MQGYEMNPTKTLQISNSIGIHVMLRVDVVMSSHVITIF